MLDIKKTHHQNQKRRGAIRLKTPRGKKLDEYLRAAEDEVQSFQASLEENC